MGGFQHQEPRFQPRQRDDPYARRIFDLRLGDRAHADRRRLHAGLGRLSRAAARHLSAAEAENRRTGLGTSSMMPCDVGLAVMVDLPKGGAGLQYRDGGTALGLALSGLRGRMMMPHCAMQKRVSPERENALDNAGNSRATGGPPSSNA